MVYVIYDSLTGQTKKFANSLGVSEVYSVEEAHKVPDNSKVILCTRSFKFGEVPESTRVFLKENYKRLNILGTAVSGNKNWGPIYGNAAKIIEQTAKIPNIVVFEASGLPSDVEKVKRFIKENE